ncbi:hypothetical protein RJ639_012612 [Escallonia herrerae]|uniref:Protein kinase domain-containing protein n=1 Tax=Escallonia herrerae TaxID=1293975 RepID=A0AA88VNS9_9ASTE|nr:hypothetical protein RJ639_012612 [Escallonia herrerae]
MKNFLAFVLLFHGPIWVSHLSVIDARPDPPGFSLSAPVSSPAVSPFPSLPASMAGIQIGTVKHHMDLDKKLLVSLIVASTALAAIMFSMLCLWVFHRKNLHKSRKDSAHGTDVRKGHALAAFMGKYGSFKTSCKKGSVSLMDYKFLETATNHFRESDILGVGGFGCVYKARLADNLDAAVKKLEGGSPDAIKEFQTEVDLLSRIQHPNVISLLGCSVHGETRLLVYELMQNGSLETQLHGPSHGSALAWHHRMKIALDTARGLEYLHEHCSPQVIHRDLKSSNILLDSSFNAKLSDFGLAITDGTQNKNNFKLSGTLGYVAPEYLLDGKLTDKSDVYAFGVVLLELLLGRKPVEKLAPSQCQSIVTWAMPQLTDRTKLPNIVDPVIRDTMDLKHLYQVAAVAVLCVPARTVFISMQLMSYHSLTPHSVPVELGGTLRVTQDMPPVAKVIPSDH